MDRYCIGIDVSKDSLAVCLACMSLDREIKYLQSRSFSNTTSGFKQILKWLKTKDIDAPLFVMEVTGVYYENLAYFLDEHDCSVSVLLPSKVNAYAKSLNWKSKTDRIDAKVLATLGLERKLPVWQVPDEDLRVVKQLTRERQELIKQRTRINNQLHSKKAAYRPTKAALSRAKKSIRLINKHIDHIEQELEEIISQNNGLKQLVDRLTTIKGLGFLSVVTILGETNGFALFENRKQLTSYAGYDVVEKESGTSVKAKTKISKRGNKHIRRALQYPALTAKIHDPKLKAFYERLYQKSGVKMLGVVAVQRKLLLLMYSLYKTGQTYQSNRKAAINSHLSLDRDKSLPSFEL